ncbi:MAG: hypothetical protein RLZZ511_1743 [Cyanobacteriota bacterium]|jgi:hypothetical protein
MTQNNPTADLKQQARSGQLPAIRQLMTQVLHSQGIRVQISQNANDLKIFLEAKTLPDQVSITDILQRGMRDLKCPNINTLKILARSSAAPDQQWSQEVYLRIHSDAGFAPQLMNQEQVNRLVDTGTQKTQALAASSKRVIQGLPLKRIAKFSGIGAIGVGLLAGGIFGARTGWDFWQHRQILTQADQTIAAAANPETLKSAAGIQTAQTNLNKTKTKLAKLTAVSGSSGKQAKAKVAKIDQQLTVLSQRLTQENSGSDVLSRAKDVIMSNHQLLQTKPHVIAKWEAAQEESEQITKELKVIPPETAVAATAKASLTKIQEQEVQIDKALLLEEKAFQGLIAAHQIAQKAEEASKKIGYQAELEEFQKVYSLWQQAAEELKKVPAKSGTATLLGEYRSVYEANRDAIGAGVKKLAECEEKQRQSKDDVLTSYSSCSYTLSELVSIPDPTASSTYDGQASAVE